MLELQAWPVPFVYAPVGSTAGQWTRWQPATEASSIAIAGRRPYCRNKALDVYMYKLQSADQSPLNRAGCQLRRLRRLRRLHLASTPAQCMHLCTSIPSFTVLALDDVVAGLVKAIQCHAMMGCDTRTKLSRTAHQMEPR